MTGDQQQRSKLVRVVCFTAVVDGRFDGTQGSLGGPHLATSLVVGRPLLAWPVGVVDHPTTRSG